MGSSEGPIFDCFRVTVGFAGYCHRKIDGEATRSYLDTSAGAALLAKSFACGFATAADVEI